MGQFKRVADVVHAVETHGDKITNRRFMKFEGNCYQVKLEHISYKREGAEGAPEKVSWFMELSRNEESSRFLPYLSVTPLETENGIIPVDIRVQTTSYGAVTISEAEELAAAVKTAVEEAQSICKAFIEPIRQGIDPNLLPFEQA